MKYYTDALVNEVKKKKRFSSFFLGDSRRNCFYQATHREDGTFLLWIEGIHLGKVISYPCVLIRGAETMVFENGSLDISKENNRVLIETWQAAVDPRRIGEYEVTPMEKGAFHELFGRYRKQHLDWAIAQAEEENRLAEEREAAGEAAEQEQEQIDGQE